MNNVPQNKYAFISYSHHDAKMAKWLHRKLESYKLPTSIHNEFMDSKYLRPIFRDIDDLNTGILGDELRKQLWTSKYLIIICSSNSSKSEWVSNEVKTFLDWNRLDCIIPIIIESSPNSKYNDKYLPLSLRQYITDYPKKELLTINIAEIGREKTFIRIVSRILGISYDKLWKRHERERKRRFLITSISIPLVLFLFYYFAIPVSLTIEICDERHNLPLPENATLFINNAEYPLKHIDTTFTIESFPGFYRGMDIPIIFSSNWYDSIDERVSLGWGINTVYKRTLHRDFTFSHFSGRVIDEKGFPIVCATVYIDKKLSLTDSSGYFTISFPIEQQTETKRIRIKKDGYFEYSREDEIPDTSLIYILREK